jgi:hypothetical protein
MDIKKKFQFVELRARGLSYDKISKKINVSKPTLIKLGRELADEILELNEDFVNELIEQSQLSLARQMERIKERLDAIQDRLSENLLSGLDNQVAMNAEIKYLKLFNQLFKDYLQPKKKVKKKKNVNNLDEGEAKKESKTDGVGNIKKIKEVKAQASN